MYSITFPRLAETYLGLAAACLNACFRVALVPLLVTPLFDEVLSQGTFNQVPRLLALGLVVVLLQSLMLFAQDAFLGKTAAIVSATWREGIYKNLLARQVGTLPGTSGGLSGRLLTDLKDVEMYLQYGLGTLFAETLTLVGIFAVLFYYHVPATLLLIAFTLPLVIMMRFLGVRLEKVTQGSQADLEAVAEDVQEGLNQHRVVKAFFASGFMLKRFGFANERAKQSMVKRTRLAALQTPVAQVLVFVAIGSLIALLTQAVASSAMTLGELTTYITLVALLATPAQLLPRGYALFQQARAASTRLESLLVTPALKRQAVHQPKTKATGLVAKDLTFNYVDKSILKKTTFQLPAKALVAVTGESGVGKTTLLQLLLHFLQPVSGAVYLNGEYLANLPEETLRKKIAFVPQDNDLLRGTLRDNLSLGRDLTDKALWRVLEEVGLAEVVKALPLKLEHTLGEDGEGLSGGQKQRLAVARALISEPDMLLLDEPSANLDSESEAKLVTLLKNQANERLVMVVAHRPALIDAADSVLELAEGTLTLRNKNHAL